MPSKKFADGAEIDEHCRPGAMPSTCTNAPINYVGARRPAPRRRLGGHIEAGLAGGTPAQASIALSISRATQQICTEVVVRKRSHAQGFTSPGGPRMDFR